MQTVEGYVENDRFYPVGKKFRVRGRFRAFITILDEPAKIINKETSKNRFAEFDRLVVKSTHEELRFEDFPRGKFERELVIFDDEDNEL